MTTEIFFSTNKLGEVTDEQLRMMLNRFDLGELVFAEKTSKGAGNQTMFITTNEGKYVLKGNPLYIGQFAEEKFFVDNLLHLTKLPVPSPYLVDHATDIFGWSYSIMPRLQGSHMSDPLFKAGLCLEDREAIAELLAESLNEMHNWEADSFGEYDPAAQKVRPFEPSYKEWLYERIRYWLKDAQKYSEITSDDIEWVEGLLADAEEAFDRFHSPCYVMGDFKADNLLIQYVDNGWRLSGIFDFTNGHFGDGIADLSKIAAMYVDNGEEELAKRFTGSYFNRSNIEVADFIKRFSIHMLHQRVLDWGCAKAINNVTWDDRMSFSDWAAACTGVAQSMLNGMKSGK